jgi:carboxyl-terminal processing protease
MKTILIALLVFSYVVQAAAPEKYENWKDRPNEKFTEPEANFKTTLDKLQLEYVDKGVSKEDLYRAATAGMLDALNPGEHSWNTLLTPGEVKELEADLSGKVSGIGLVLKFDKDSGNTHVLDVIANTPSFKAGVKRDDLIVSVDGKRYKGKKFSDLVGAIRGKVGDKVALKILRDDKMVNLSVTREPIAWTPVEISKLNATTQVLTIGYFTGATPKLVEQKMAEINAPGVKNLIVDLRGNSGGSFEKAVQTAELFVPKDAPIVRTSDREGKTETFKSTKGLLRKDIQVIVLTNGDTSSGAELLTGALQEGLHAKTVGETTFGKWNVQSIQTLTNGFAIKYSILAFQTPGGHSYQGAGIKPDVEVAVPKAFDAKALRESVAGDKRIAVDRRLGADPQLKAAAELGRAGT